jgi:hypothetical protein
MQQKNMIFFTLSSLSLSGQRLFQFSYQYADDKVHNQITEGVPFIEVRAYLDMVIIVGRRLCQHDLRHAYDADKGIGEPCRDAYAENIQYVYGYLTRYVVDITEHGDDRRGKRKGFNDVEQ